MTKKKVKRQRQQMDELIELLDRIDPIKVFMKYDEEHQIRVLEGLPPERLAVYRSDPRSSARVAELELKLATRKVVSRLFR